MTTFKESRTAQKVLISFAFESQANMRYRFFADQAEKDGYIQIAHIFRETAEQEFEHALRFFKFFNGGELEITARFPTGVIRETRDNLMSSADLEYHVGSELYPEFAAIARTEGFDRAAELWEAISIAERHHEKSFRQLAENIRTGRIFKREQKRVWRCRNCGYLYEGMQAPDKCPACVKPAGFFELLAENW